MTPVAPTPSAGEGGRLAEALARAEYDVQNADLLKRWPWESIDERQRAIYYRATKPHLDAILAAVAALEAEVQRLDFALQDARRDAAEARRDALKEAAAYVAGWGLLGEDPGAAGAAAVIAQRLRRLAARDAT